MRRVTVSLWFPRSHRSFYLTPWDCESSTYWYVYELKYQGRWSVRLPKFLGCVEIDAPYVTDITNLDFVVNRNMKILQKNNMRWVHTAEYPEKAWLYFKEWIS